MPSPPEAPTTAPKLPELTRPLRWLVGTVCAGGVVIAGIGFAGSYAAVRKLAEGKGFGTFAYFLPVGIDAGIVVLLALDLLLTWIRIPFPLLRQTAWVLTAATIAFNGAAAWPDPLGVGMHAVIPVLFVVAVEAARHAVGRIADITAEKHMEGVRLTRWLLSPLPTFLLWRRMKLWELRSYEAVIKVEQERMVYQALLNSRFGRGWRRKAPVESLMPLRLARYGVPLAETAPAGLAAAGIEPAAWAPADGGPVESAEAPAEADPIDLDQHAATAIGIASAPRAAALPRGAGIPAQHAQPGPVDLPWPDLRTHVLRAHDERATAHAAAQSGTAQQGAQGDPSESAQDVAQQTAQPDVPDTAQAVASAQLDGDEPAQQGAQDRPKGSADTSANPQGGPRKPPGLRKPKPRAEQSLGARNQASETAQRAARKTPAEQAAWDAQIYALRNPEDGSTAPSNRAIATQHDCSEGTVRNALQRHEKRLADERRQSLHAVNN
ncbi:DUF2637 domain-containing protein [Streptomyces sp. NPDC058247]|uniref:DUF2637 domain-containing protein n=1 Tax=Streptomyces sp. NPDC058247 TaxID=3346401 RepID=UPI0036EE0547